MSVLVGSISFTAVNPIGNTSDIDITLGEFVSAFDQSFDNSGNRITPTFQGASITVVPEPSAIVVLCAAGGAMMFLRRRRRSLS
ncbi:hypothetical protein Mal15_30340 [Stieleria maiorica]|uniref:PEP-CTERM protein-sorting domain-containing protein n=1 Tax=Stieleria maiorica TaxID=2795974 RepID=A0A5B9MFU2_9BACT|nr:PEP-CTERM sorting domain-containing protein [Stieleria maiorica]QEF98976.1 hypothetical protein Mal15_30340 [Stieleria maiorica]